MRKLILAALLALPTTAQAVCTTGGSPFNLEIPSLGDSAATWSACLRRDLLKISTGAMPVSGSTLTVPSWVGIQVSSIQARNASGIYIASTTVVGSSMSVTAGAGLDVWYGFRAATMTATGLITGSSVTATGTGGAFAVTSSTGIRIATGRLSLGTGGFIEFADGTTQTTASSGGGVFSSSFESAEISITASSRTTVAHGLGGVPKIWSVVIRCKTAENGYLVGDEILITQTDAGDGVYRNAVWANAELIGVNINSRPWLLESRTAGGSYFTLTLANWRLVFRGYR